MAAISGRGAQATLGPQGRAAARGSYTTTLEGNGAQMLTLVNAGTEPAGTTVDGTTSTGAGPVDVLTGAADGLNSRELSVSNTLTAHAGGTQAAALALTSSINRVTIVATAADSVRLPTMAAGQMVVVINSDSTDSLQVFGASTATINDVATATGVALAAGKVGIYFAVTAGLIYGGALA
jgi:hypothetical protein